MSLLAGRHALVTGAANGIGRAIAERFHAEGARVSGVDVEPGAEFQADLAETERLRSLVDEVEAAGGPVDVLVNNAAIAETASVLELELELYRRVLAVNLDAAVFLAARAARGMVERGYGRILNITSIHGEFGEETTLAYDVAKGGLNQATRTLAVELSRHGVLVNAIAPGFVRTRMGMVDGKHELEHEPFRSIYVEHGKLPVRRAAEPPEIAAHAAWLCSEENTYLTGQIVTVDGGLTVTF